MDNFNILVSGETNNNSQFNDTHLLLIKWDNIYYLI